jgi:hypothetical protein
MSHYTVMVCLPGDTEKVDEALARVLAPYDENMTVEPRRDYEEGGPEDHWFVSSIRRNAEHHRSGTGLKPYEPDGFFSYSSSASKKTHDEQRAEFAEWAALEPSLDSPVSWPVVAKLVNEKYEYTERDEDGDLNREMLHVDEDGRAYTWTTYNPDSKWDYWRIGGRWRNYFISTVQVKTGPDWEDGKALIRSSKGWDSPEGGDMTPDGFIRCDGGPKRLLNFEAMRARAGAEADERYGRYEQLVAQHGTAQPWSHFYGLVEVGDLDMDTARAQYRGQPLIMAHNALPYEDQLTGMGCLVDEFFLPCKEYVLAARNGAVPCYATVTLSGEWTAPGRMGWWGVSSDERGEREAYHVAMNKYLDELKPDTVLVVVDCHI